MKKLLGISSFFLLSNILHAENPTADQKIKGWKLVWNDEFNRKKIDSDKWAPCERGKADWQNTMTTDPKVFGIGNGYLELKGVVNKDQKKDSAPFLTGGVRSQGKYSFKYGKVLIRARFDSAKGAWPALWMLGDKGSWPGNGEIDLMEHLNFDDKVYQTIHSKFTQAGNHKPDRGLTVPIKRDKFNTYGVEWDESQMTLTVNGKNTLTYPRLPEKGKDQWPFDQSFYFVLSMQIGGDWVGPGDPKDYPASMKVDWVRVYEKE